MDVGINCFKLQPHEGILLEDGCSECSISAGDLWQHLKAQGIDSTEQLVFLVDFGNAGSHNPLKLEALEFTILDSGNNQLTKMLLDKNGDNQLLIPGMDGFNLRPEAQMKVELGYDFMSRFNANSTELVAFRSRVSGAGEHAPQFIVPGTQRSFGRTNFLIMFGFIGFWCMLFWALRRTTLPKNNSDPKNNSRKLVLSNTKDKSVSSGAV
jgi:hypothetical protein